MCRLLSRPSDDAEGSVQHTGSNVAWLWTTGLIRCLSLTVSLSQEGGSLVDSRGVLRLPLYTAWLELYQKEVTFDL